MLTDRRAADNVTTKAETGVMQSKNTKECKESAEVGKCKKPDVF